TQMYLPALKACGADPVAISDPLPEALERADADCPRFTDHRELLASVRPDFVFAMAPHCDMTALAADLVEADQPFAMEKPMGVDWRALEAVAQRAGAKGLFAAVALVTRYFPLIEKLADLSLTGEVGQPVHYYSRLFAGAPQRYRDWHVDWMLDPARAGAGPLYNFGPHVIDIFLHLFRDSIETVSGSATHGLYGEAIEDLASVTFHTRGGAVGVVEVSYTHPSSYERYFSLTTSTLHVGGKIEGDAIHFRDGGVVDVVPDRSATQTYEVYTADTLERFAGERPPKASIHDMWPTLRVLNAALGSIRAGKPVALGEMR
ncbi:MAG: Gfo/Idh/MocA family oxidoreductase, partial [Armatimonadetes bacterium]|nr:Gfo/Idh/MocA family oxidoreductase [Armatimonadota bacterium]